MPEQLARAWPDLAFAGLSLVLGAVFAPLTALLLPLALVVAGAVLFWRRPEHAAGRWLLRAGAALAILTAIFAIGLNGDSSSHVHRL